MSIVRQTISELQQPGAVSLPRQATGQVGSREYKYLTLDKLHEEVLPKLAEKGLVWYTYPTTTPEGAPGLGYCLAEIDGDEHSVEGVMPICPPKNDPQGLGAAITYARRYALLSVLGLVGEDDTDGAVSGAQGNSEAPQEERPKVPEIPIDRAKKILEAAQAAGLAEDIELKPALVAKLTEVGVETGRLGHLNVDQAEQIEDFIAKEAA